MGLFTKQVKGQNRINGVVAEFQKQIAQLETGIAEVETEMAGNMQTVEAIKAEALRVETEMAARNEELTGAVPLASNLKSNIASLLG